GDVAGEVTHPLDSRGHPQRRDDDAQIGGHRGLPGEQRDALLVEAPLHVVDLLVRPDDVLRQLEVGRLERRGGVLDRVDDEPAHPLEIGPDLLQLLVEDLAHSFPPKLVLNPTVAFQAGVNERWPPGERTVGPVERRPAGPGRGLPSEAWRGSGRSSSSRCSGSPPGSCCAGSSPGGPAGTPPWARRTPG